MSSADPKRAETEQAYDSSRRATPLVTMRRRVGLGVTSLLIAGVLLVAAVVATLFSNLIVCDGDGGYPFSARASVAGRMCTSTTGDVYSWAQLIAPVAIVLLAGVLAVVLGRALPIVVATGVSIVVIAVLAIILTHLPQGCTADQLRTLSRDQCETY